MILHARLVAYSTTNAASKVVHANCRKTSVRWFAPSDCISFTPAIAYSRMLTSQQCCPGSWARAVCTTVLPLFWYSARTGHRSESQSKLMLESLEDTCNSIYAELFFFHRLNMTNITDIQHARYNSFWPWHFTFFNHQNANSIAQTLPTPNGIDRQFLPVTKSAKAQVVMPRIQHNAIATYVIQRR